MSSHIKSSKFHIPEPGGRAGKTYFRLSDLDNECFDISVKSAILMFAGILVFFTAGFFDLSEPVVTGIRTAAVLAAGMPLLRNLLCNFKAGRILSPALFVFASAVCCYIIELYTGAILIVAFYEIFYAGELLLSDRTERKIYSELKLLPDFAYVVIDGEKRRVKTIHLKEDDVIFVDKGGIVPVDGVVTEGTASLDISPLTKQTENITAREGGTVMSGSINLSDGFVMKAVADSRHSTAQKIYSSFIKCASEPIPESRAAAKWTEFAVPIFLALFLLFAFAVPLFTRKQIDGLPMEKAQIQAIWAEGIRKGSIFLLCALPLELTGRIDLAAFHGIGKIFSAGAVIKSSGELHQMEKVCAFVCNKTCTVTEDSYRVVDICPHGMTEDEMLTFINAVEKYSVHPIAEAIRAYSGLEEKPITAYKDPAVAEIPGRGISASLGGNRILVGNAPFLYEHGINSEVPEKQGSVVHLAVNGNYCGYVVLENRVRQGSYDAIERLKSYGVKNCAMLSDDLRSVVRPIAGALNFNVVNAEMTPETKISATEYLLSNKMKNTTMLFAGNGYDELAAASKADISVSLGALGIENALSDFSVAVMGGGLTAVPEMISAAKKSARAVYINIAGSIAIRLLFVILALFNICPVIVCMAALIGCAMMGTLLSSVFFDMLQ